MKEFKVGEVWRDREGNFILIEATDDDIDDPLDWWNIRGRLEGKSDISTLYTDIIYYDCDGKGALSGNEGGKWDLVERVGGTN